MSADGVHSRKNVALISIGFLLLIVSNLSLIPVFLSFGITFIVCYDVKVKNGHSGSFYSGVVALSLVLMFVLEYFLVPIENIIFYILLIVLSVGWFLIFYILFNCTHFNQKERIIVWIGIILYATSFSALLGVAHNEFMLALIIGVFVLIILLTTFFVQKRRFGKYF